MVLAGVPQGSVLGPLLFLVFINDLFDVVSNNLDVFADDSSLWRIIDTPASRPEAASALNADLQAIQSWAAKWLVTYNHTKTELVTFSKKRDVTGFHKNGLHRDGFFLPGPVICPHPPLVFYGENIPERPQVKIVGLIFSHNLTWSAHVDSVYKKANRSLALLRRAKPVLNSDGLATIYKSFVRSQLEYCSPLWMGAPADSLHRLDRIQVRATRILGHTVGNDLESLDHRRMVSAKCAMHRLINKKSPPPLHSLIPVPHESKRSSARSSSSSALFIPNKKTEYWLQSFIPKVSKAWNLMPPDVRSLQDPKLFKSAVIKQ